MIPIPVQQKVKSTLDPYEKTLSKLPFLALQIWQKNPDFPRLNHPRIRANVIWGLIISFAQELLSDDPNVKFLKHHNTVSIRIIGFKHEVLLRYKKANRKKLSSNVKTNLSDGYHDHGNRELFLFDDMSDPDRIEVVYILNQLATAIEDIRVVARLKKLVIWSYSIKPVAEVIDIPISTKPKPIQKPEFKSHADEIAKPKKDSLPKEEKPKEGE